MIGADWYDDEAPYRPIVAHGVCRRCGWLCERRRGQANFYRASGGTLCLDEQLHDVEPTGVGGR